MIESRGASVSSEKQAGLVRVTVMSDLDGDIDDLLLGTVGQPAKHYDSAKKRARDLYAMLYNRRRDNLTLVSTPSDESDLDSDTSATGFVHPYPLEGQYKDSTDRDR